MAAGIRKFTVIVCGGRTYGVVARNEKNKAKHVQAENERAALILTLDELKPDLVLHGDASGADRLAQRWCEQNGVPYVAYPANWSLGNVAGPKRNADMAADLKRYHKQNHDRIAVVAFPGGAGTQSMCNIAQRSGIEVIYADKAFGSLVETQLAARQLSLESQLV